MDSNARLKAFRSAAYKNLCRAHDATFELTDAVIVTRKADCLADLSLSPVFRRKWSSTYVRVRAACRFATQRVPLGLSITGY